jgi:hypothetical protein
MILLAVASPLAAALSPRLVLLGYLAIVGLGMLVTLAQRGRSIWLELGGARYPSS